MTEDWREITRESCPPGIAVLINVMSLGVPQAGNLRDGPEPAIVCLKCSVEEWHKLFQSALLGQRG